MIDAIIDIMPDYEKANDLIIKRTLENENIETFMRSLVKNGIIQEQSE